MQPWSIPPGRRAHATSLCHRCRHNRYILSGKGSLFLQCTVKAQRYMAQPQRRCSDFHPAPIVHLGGALIVWRGEAPRPSATYRTAPDGRLDGPPLSAPVSVLPGDGLLAEADGMRWVSDPVRGPVLGWRIAGAVRWDTGETLTLTTPGDNP